MKNQNFNSAIVGQITLASMIVLIASLVAACGGKSDSANVPITGVRSQKPVQPLQPIKPSVVAPDGTQKTAAEVPLEIPLPTQTTAPAPEELENKYSAVSADDLRSQLSKLLSETARSGLQKESYEQIAQSIRSVRAEIDDKNMILKVERFDQAGGSVTWLKGKLDFESGMASLNTSKDNSADEKITGSAMCLDQDPKKCLVVLVHLKIGAAKSPVFALVRRTSSKVSFPEASVPSDVAAKNEEAPLFLSYFENTRENANLDAQKDTQKDAKAKIEPSLKAIEFTSSEVVLGRTEMNLIILMSDKQMISAAGPVRAAIAGPVRAADVDWSKDVDLKTLTGVDRRKGFLFDLQAMIKSVRMTSNDGKGNVTLKFGDVSLEFSRVQPLIKSLEQIRRDAQKFGADLGL